ncbi:MAG: eukaryotic-like serine/threonine-protein kinase, partial [Myxococcales bacterium]|nr:eukaryotic-like serine/threonine-protein kinase [Myxococcales bacterium]
SCEGNNHVVKRLVAIIVAAAALGAAAAAARAIDANRNRSVKKESARAAETAGLRSNEALASHVHELKFKIDNAAANPRFAAALRGNVDAATLSDVFRTEEWWAPYRREFRVYAVSFKGEKLDVVEGMAGSQFVADSLIRGARQKREAVAEIVLGKGWPYAAAAVTVSNPDRSEPAVLVLAKPIDEASMRFLVDKVHGAVMLSDGKSVVIDAGAANERELLHRALGQERAGSLFEPAEATWAAAVSQLAPNLWLWTYAGAGAAVEEAASSAATAKSVVWGVAGLGSILALFFGLRRRSAAPAPAMSASTGGTTEGYGYGSAPGLTPPRPSQAAAVRSTAALGSAATEIHRGTPESVKTPNTADAVMFGRYRLLDRLGEGGMAEVYTAVTFGAEGFRRTFVVKRLRAELAREPNVVAQFIDEANLGSTLVHSNIVPVFDFGKVNDEYFLAQEYILGRDLARLTARVVEKQGHTVPVPVVMYVVHETLKALEYAHGRLNDVGKPLGIVHRDVSPSNVLVSARGEVKLFDFGIVKAEGRVTKTQHGVVKGNVSFMAPEQARGTETDARADLFSLGLVMFYCLTGEILYQGNTTYELLVKAATGPGPEELARIAALPGPCAEIVAKALQTDPAQRYQSAAEFAAAVHPHTTGGASATLQLVRALFAADFQAEEARFANAVPTNQRMNAATFDSGEVARPRRS